VHNLLTEDSLVSQLAKCTFTSTQPKVYFCLFLFFFCFFYFFTIFVGLDDYWTALTPFHFQIFFPFSILNNKFMWTEIVVGRNCWSVPKRDVKSLLQLKKVNLLLLGLMFCFNIVVAREGFYLHLLSRSAPSHFEVPVASRECFKSFGWFCD
jgi:cytochrome bd-type quinol oxidase subunit 1